jgi:hypothetical protein
VVFRAILGQGQHTRKCALRIVGLLVEFIDENGGGPGGAATKAAPEEELGWAKQQKDRPSRSEAIRRLIEIALATKLKRQSGRGEK